jgi:mono/diheme cytochrome c family protein
MSTRKLCTIVCFSLLSGSLLAQESPGLGEDVTAEELAAVDYAILPNGDGLPAGSGTAAEGAMVYQQYCFACHGEKGKGGTNDALSGGHGSLTSARPQKTVGSFWPYATTVFDYVRRAMPHQSPGILSNDELYAVTAYILFVNDVIGEDQEIDADTLPAVKMPNRDNFVWDYSEGE